MVRVDKARITRSEPLGRDRHRIEALVDTFFVDRSFAVVLVRESGYDVFDGEGLLEGEHVPWSELARNEAGTLVLELPMPTGVSLEEIAELRAVRPWKIEAFELLNADAPAP